MIESGQKKLDIELSVKDEENIVFINRKKSWKKRQEVAKDSSSTVCDLSVVVPTRNERDNVLPLLEALEKVLGDLRIEVIFVDDSDDDTPQVIEEAAKTISSAQFRIQLEHRLAGAARAGGLATAVVYGMNKARAAYVAVLDADFQHPPEMLRVFYKQAVAKNVDIVVASRYIKGGSYEGLAGVGRRCISIGLKWLAKLLFPGHLLHVSDPLGGFFLLRRSLLDGVSLHPIGYKILLEILIRCPWQQALEVPYHFQVRAHGQSKANMRQGILALQHMQLLWHDAPNTGRAWKISFLLLLNILILATVFMANRSFSGMSINLDIVILGTMVLLDIVFFGGFLFAIARRAK